MQLRAAWVLASCIICTIAYPYILAHRGSSGELPEETLASWGMAMNEGADYVEADVVITKDHQLVARHDVELTRSTNVADHPEFADRKTTRIVDGETWTGWFASDFTLAEIRTLRSVQPNPKRGHNFDDLFDIYTLGEYLQFVRAYNLLRNTKIGVYIETKNPSYHRALGFDLTPPLLAALNDAGYLPSGNSEFLPVYPIFIESFESWNLIDLHEVAPTLPLIYLRGEDCDFDASPAGLSAMAVWAAGLGVAKNCVIPISPSTTTIPGPTDLVERAHAAKLLVHIWTINENPAPWTSEKGEYTAFFEAGVDGLFTDWPEHAAKACTEWIQEHNQPARLSPLPQRYEFPWGALILAGVGIGVCGLLFFAWRMYKRRGKQEENSGQFMRVDDLDEPDDGFERVQAQVPEDAV